MPSAMLVVHIGVLCDGFERHFEEAALIFFLVGSTGSSSRRCDAVR